jgi:DNA-binding CsgD family transcriptional regulator
MDNPNNYSLGFDPRGDLYHKSIVERMLEANGHLVRESAQEQEREEIICRLLASGMSVEEISLRVKIRADKIRIIESNNAKIKIPEYTRTYKVRAKSRAKADK